jgi:hypothetical protein
VHGEVTGGLGGREGRDGFRFRFWLESTGGSLAKQRVVEKAGAPPQSRTRQFVQLRRREEEERARKRLEGTEGRGALVPAGPSIRSKRKIKPCRYSAITAQAFLRRACAFLFFTTSSTKS